MAENNPAAAAGKVPTAPPEAKNDIGLQIGSKTVRITDKDGKEHVLSPFDIEDLADLEEMLGEDWLQMGRLRGVTRILWVAMRKEGLSREDVVARKWRMKPAEVGMLFDVRHGPMIRAAVTDILVASGYERKPQSSGGRPPEGASEQTGAPSSKSPGDEDTTPKP